MAAVVAAPAAPAATHSRAAPLGWLDRRQSGAHIVERERVCPGVGAHLAPFDPRDRVGSAQEVLGERVGVEAGERGQAEVRRGRGHRARAVARLGRTGGKGLGCQGQRARALGLQTFHRLSSLTAGGQMERRGLLGSARVVHRFRPNRRAERLRVSFYSQR